MAEMQSPFSYYVFDDEDEDMIFDERGNTFLAMRRVQWDSKNVGKDIEKSKLELRKWIIDKDCSERPNKGFSFLTEEGPNNLAVGLVEKGYGDTKALIKALASREDFKDTIENMEEVPDSNGEYFDARSYLEAM